MLDHARSIAARDLVGEIDRAALGVHEALRGTPRARRGCRRARVSTSRLPTERPAASSTRSLRYATDSGALRIRSTAPARTASTASSYERRGVIAIDHRRRRRLLDRADRRDAGARRRRVDVDERDREELPLDQRERASRRRSTHVTCRFASESSCCDAGVDALVAVEHEHLDADERCVRARVSGRVA